MTQAVTLDSLAKGQTFGDVSARTEALRILSWWASHTVDEQDGGFYGEVDSGGRAVPGADKGGVLNARLLWFFSAIAHRYRRADALALAHRAFDYIISHFVDPAHEGIYWSVTAGGQVKNSRKQAYAQAFAVYGLTEYYVATGKPEALTLAKRLLCRIEAAFWDESRGGYIEARSLDWGDLADQRLSDKDLDCPKTMNTHLHILEAYTRLFQVAPSADIGEALRRATDILLSRFIDNENKHLRLFFDLDWTDRTHSISFGHDIEASWLIWEAVETLGDPALMHRARPIVLGLAQATLAEGVLADGAIAYERIFDGSLDPDGEWWGQAEGLIGFVNAWQITQDDAYASAAERLWVNIGRRFASNAAGEWTWYAADSPRPAQSLAGPWKCPYHNGRAMLELDRRLNTKSRALRP